MTMVFTSLFVISIVLFVKAEVYLNVKNESCSERARVKLICEGVDLEGLRWRYSSPNFTKYVDIFEFLVDASPQIVLSNITKNKNPAFLSIQLIAVSHFFESDMANYSSILTVDLLALEKQNVTSITCGDVVTYMEILVSDIIVWDPVNTMITAIYQLGVLTNVEVQLRNLLMCSSILMYTVTINGSDEIKIVRTCVSLFCEARFSSIRTIMGEYNIELSLFTTRSSKNNTFVIGLKSENYFHTQVNSTNCLYSVSCTVIQNDSNCSIRHTTLRNQPINGTELLKIPYSNPGTVHKFAFSMEANKNLLIKENISVTDGIPFGTKSTAILISTTSLFLLLTAIHFILLLIGACCKVKAFVYRKKSLVSSLVILLVLLFMCISSSFALGIISYGTQCSQIRLTLHNSMLVTMLIISCLGITILITVWSFIGHGVYKHRKSTLRSENRDLRNTQLDHDSKTDAYCTTQGRNAYLSQTAASSKYPGRDMRSRDCQKKSQYDMLEHPLTNRFSSYSCDVKNDFYGTLNEEALIELKLGGDPYEQLRPGEKSRPVPNLTDTSYSHIAKRKSKQISTAPDVVFRSRSEDEYDVLSRQSINFQDATNGSRLHSFYGELSQASIEPSGAGLYLQLRHGEKSKPVPNMDDPTYSHVHIEPEVEGSQAKPN